jgi:hypothetical protein
MSGRKTKNTGFNIGSFLALLGFVSCILFSASTAVAATISEEFSSTTSYAPGTIVSIKQDSPKEVELSNKKNAEYLLGVVATPETSAITYAVAGASVNVATTGTTEVFVTDANGAIKKGDNIVVSWIQGIGMKETVSENERLLGVATTDFDTTKAKTYKSTSDGAEKTISISSVPVRLFKDPTHAKDVAPQRAGLVGVLSSVAGKDVSYIRSIVSLMIFVLCLVVTALFMGTSLYSSFISLGRNPLAGASIFKSLSRVTLIAVIIILIGTALAYAVLVV